VIEKQAKVQDDSRSAGTLPIPCHARYCDTDSVSYVQKKGPPPAVVCGDKLGDMRSELGIEEYVEKFVSWDPRIMPTQRLKQEKWRGKRYVKSAE
jgi:hypothetical protein